MEKPSRNSRVCITPKNINSCRIATGVDDNSNVAHRPIQISCSSQNMAKSFWTVKNSFSCEGVPLSFQLERKLKIYVCESFNYASYFRLILCRLFLSSSFAFLGITFITLFPFPWLPVNCRMFRQESGANFWISKEFSILVSWSRGPGFGQYLIALFSASLVSWATEIALHDRMFSFPLLSDRYSIFVTASRFK